MLFCLVAASDSADVVILKQNILFQSAGVTVIIRRGMPSTA